MNTTAAKITTTKAPFADSAYRVKADGRVIGEVRKNGMRAAAGRTWDALPDRGQADRFATKAEAVAYVVKMG